MHDLSPLQRSVLEAFFENVEGFVLAGGAALVGFVLHHRETHDLDLFTTDRDRLDEGERVLQEVADRLGCGREPLQRSPSFRRYLIRSRDEAVLVDLIYDPMPRGERGIERRGKIAVASPQEILAGKLCALLSRGEIRDLVDVMWMERAGFDVDRAMIEAAMRDSAFSAGQLAWVLSEIRIGEDAALPAGVGRTDLVEWMEGFIARLVEWAYPEATE